MGFGDGPLHQQKCKKYIRDLEGPHHLDTMPEMGETIQETKNLVRYPSDRCDFVVTMQEIEYTI